MTVRRSNAERNILILAAAVILPLLAAGCTTTPEPYFGWDTQTARHPVHRVAMIKPKPRPMPTYEEARYSSDRYGSYRYRNDRYDMPAQNTRSSQKWYDRPADPNDDSDYRPDRPSSDYAGSVRFQWPVRGRVVLEYGTSPGGERNNGINIATADREQIHAAADGVVSYVGELHGYGNLVLIRHGNGYITAYAHADSFVVQKGDRVARGQVIGYVGMTGDVRTPQLHFEVRRGSHGETPIDPRQVLGSQRVAYR